MSISNAQKTDNGGAMDFCVYRGCVNGKYTTNSRLYRFPAKDDPRLPLWIRNSGNRRLNLLAPSSIRCKGLCQKHFSEDAFIGDRLSRDAVPKPWVESIRVYTPKRKSQPGANVDGPNATTEKSATTSMEIATIESYLESHSMDLDDPTSDQNSTVSTSAAQFSTSPLRSTKFFSSNLEKANEGQNSTVSTSAASISTSHLPYVETTSYEKFNDGENSRISTSNMNDAAVSFPFFESDTSKTHKSNGPQNSTVSTSATNISTTSIPIVPTIANPTTKKPREYKKVAVVFSKSDTKRCTLIKFDPAKAKNESTTTPTIPPFVISKPERTLENLEKLTASLQRQVEFLKEGMKTLQKQNMVYRQTIQGLHRKEKRMAVKNEILTIKAKKESIDEFLDRQKCEEPEPRAMIKLQLHRRKAPYTVEEKNLAKAIYKYSSAAYTSLRISGCSLPGESTVRQWIAETENAEDEIAEDEIAENETVENEIAD